MFVDFMDEELNVGDAVVMVAGKYVDLRRGVIVAFTKQKVRVMTRAEYSDRDDTILIYSGQCIRVDTELTRNAGGPWERFRRAATAQGF